MEIGLPKALMDAKIIGVCLETANVSVKDNYFSFKTEFYEVIILPNDSEMTIIEINCGIPYTYYSEDGSCYNLILKWEHSENQKKFDRELEAKCPEAFQQFKDNFLVYRKEYNFS